VVVLWTEKITRVHYHVRVNLFLCVPLSSYSEIFTYWSQLQTAKKWYENPYSEIEKKMERSGNMIKFSCNALDTKLDDVCWESAGEAYYLLYAIWLHTLQIWHNRHNMISYGMVWLQEDVIINWKNEVQKHGQ